MKGYIKLDTHVFLRLKLFGRMMPVQPAQADFIDGRQLQLYCASQNPQPFASTGAVDAVML